MRPEGSRGPPGWTMDRPAHWTAVECAEAPCVVRSRRAAGGKTDDARGGGRSGADATLGESLGRDTLYSVIGAVARGPELGTVLPAIVDLLTEATACHACFVYLIDGDRLRMRAASKVFADAVDRVSLGIDEGLCGWVVRTTSQRSSARTRSPTRA